MLFGQEHVERYRATDGEEGHEWRGTQTLLLTTKGRRSGEPRTHAADLRPPTATPTRSSPRRVAPTRRPPGTSTSPRDPEVEVQVKGDRFKARARTASSEEKPGLWKTMVAEWPDYDDYQQKTDREIPVSLLERGLSRRERPTRPGSVPARKSGYRPAAARRPLLTRRELDLGAVDRFVGDLVEQVGDQIQARRGLVVGLDHEPGRVLGVGVANISSLASA